MSYQSSRMSPHSWSKVLTMVALGCSSFVACNEAEDDTGSPTSGTGGAQGIGGMGGEGGSGQEECFSPSRPDGAYVQGAMGCSCSNYVGQSICIGGGALVCDEDIWISAEDGPCEPRIDSCAGITDSWQSCLLQFETCFETQTGKFCGRQPLEGVVVDRPECDIKFDWLEKCADYDDGIGSQIIEGCGYTWIRSFHLENRLNTIVDADGIVVFQQWDDPLSTVNPLGCRGGEIPKCQDLPDDVGGDWSDADVIKRGDQCPSGLGGGGSGSD